MASQKPSDSKLVLIKISRLLTYLVYGYSLVAITFLSIGTFLLAFSANPDTNFVKFIYSGAQNFLEPFRGIFPPKQISETGYFSTSAVFAIIMYLLLAMLLHGLINYITLKMYKHQQELELAVLESEKTPKK